MSDGQLIPAGDLDFLRARGFAFDIVKQGSDVFVLLKEFVLPAVYTPRSCTLVLKLPAGYPDANPDMFWTTPGVRLANGGTPVATEAVENYMGQPWQRWSRHNNTWRAGIDGLQTKLRAVVTELEKGR